MDGAREFVAGADDEGRRLDRVLRILLGKAGLSLIYSSIRKGRIKVNGRRAKPDQALHEGDRILVFSALGERSPSERDKAPPPPPGEGLARLVVARNRDLLVLDKPRGMLTHGEGSLESLVRASTKEVTEASLAFTPGPLHRLDRNTSGLVVFSLSIRGARDFSAALREARVSKRYLALLEGSLAAESVWEDELGRDEEGLRTVEAPGGRKALTLARPLASASGLTLAAVDIGTGRTHQIRAQCALHGHPLAGDSKYGGRKGEPYILHAWRLDFRAEAHEGMPRVVEAPLPAEAAMRLEALFGRETLVEALEAGRNWSSGRGDADD